MCVCVCVCVCDIYIYIYIEVYNTLFLCSPKLWDLFIFMRKKRKKIACLIRLQDSLLPNLV